MLAYILRRLLLVIPTLLGIMVINFTLTQFVPGGPIQSIAAKIEEQSDGKSKGSGADAGVQGQENGDYIGARGLPPEFIAQLEVEFGFARVVCDPGLSGTPDLKDPACRKE